MTNTAREVRRLRGLLRTASDEVARAALALAADPSPSNQARAAKALRAKLALEEDLAEMTRLIKLQGHLS